MSDNKPDKKLRDLLGTSISNQSYKDSVWGTPIKYEKIDIKEKKILEFIPNTIKNGEVAIVRVKKWAGISELCFAIANNNGKITIKQFQEENDEGKKDID